MAEAVFAARAAQTPLAPRLKVDSCGTAAYHVGETPDERTVATCQKVSQACKGKVYKEEMQADDG
jgi:protein-tyrosine-phosphatase